MDIFHKFRRKKAKPLVIPTISETLPPSPHQQQIESFPPEVNVRHNLTTRSNLSSYGISPDRAKDSDVERRRRERSAERHADPLGLNVIHDPDDGNHSVDIIFVHGLGGTSQKTWSRNRDVDFFWPREWLPWEPGFERARILSFGYNAHFASSGRDNILNIADFAKNLLFGMKFGLDEKSQELEVGKVMLKLLLYRFTSTADQVQAPVIFVVHSMGGLVFKKAYILAQNDEQYQSTVESACAVLFLSTPHRGTNLAELLNRILSVSVFNHSPKQYISELKQNSPALQDINEQFRNIAPKLEIFSFFETQQTAVGPRKMMVLEKDSSILGYPGEVSKPLDADHHNVCKYTSQQDPNYISVRNALRSILRKVGIPKTQSHIEAEVGTGDPSSTHRGMTKVETLTAISSPPEEDQDYFRSRWMSGSCEWLFSRPAFLSWLDDKSMTSRIIFVHGLPGCGKSVLSSFVIDQLQEAGHNCQYYYFRFGDRKKQTGNLMLRSLVYQIASQLPGIRPHLEKLADDAVRLEKAEGRVIWQKVFLSCLFKMRYSKPLYWIIDAIDECDAPRSLLQIFSTINSSQIPLRVMFVGRKTQALSEAFQRIDTSVPIEMLAADEANEDLEIYVTKEVEFMRGTTQLKARVTQTVCEKADRNFLWVHLVLKEILQCHTEAAIEQALRELPADLEPLYERMEIVLTRNSRPKDRDLSKKILKWVILSQRALSLGELSEALEPDFLSALDLRQTITQVCGDFVVVDHRGQVGMVHQTAREYLIRTPGLEHSISSQAGHQDLFLKCIAYISNPSRRILLDSSLVQPFLHYAATAWPYHLGLSSVSLDHTILHALNEFFQGSRVLIWIQLMATLNHLKSLVDASHNMTKYIERKSKVDAESSPLHHALHEREFIESWAIDLVKIMGKFGSQLAAHPRIIHTLVPAFCPTSSAIFQHIDQDMDSGPISVRGFSQSKWDDCLSRFTVGHDAQCLKLTCAERYFAILTSNGAIRLFDTTTHQALQKLVHGERVLTFRFSPSHERCVTYGFRTTKVWDVKHSRQICAITNPNNAKALDITFSSDESMILTCCDDRSVNYCRIEQSETVWQTLTADLQPKTSDGRQHNSPRRVVFSPDGALVAVAFRGFPLLVWDVSNGAIVSRCERSSDRDNTSQDLHSEVGPVCWNPISGHILGLYKDGCIFKWHPLESKSEEVRTVASGIQCSPGGTLFITSSTNGIIKVWNFYHLALIYQISCQTPVTDMALSPDGRRIYDLRESFCTVWEPNALIRMAEGDEKSFETSSTTAASTQSSLAPEASNEMSEPLTALAVGKSASTYCSGDELGVVRIKPANDGALTQICRGFMPIDQIIWSDDERYLVTADLGGCLCVRQMNPLNPVANPSVHFETKTGNGLQQLLISRNSEYLLMATINFVELWSLASKALVLTKSNTDPFSRWINHPSDEAVLVQCTYSSIRLFRWAGLEEIVSCPLLKGSRGSEPESSEDSESQRRPSTAFPMSPDENHESIDDALISTDGFQVVLQTSTPSGQRHRTRQYWMVNAEQLTTLKAVKSTGITAHQIPFAVASRVAKILGFVFNSRRRKSRGMIGAAASEAEETLTFLDHHDWVCSWEYGSPRSKVKRHFFLPQDWLSLDNIRLATVSGDGKFYCPRNGEVAVVTNWYQHEWID
ncbi:MAG: hypothetical protein Q9220_003190 [cf. Caloplaca sp. 1 TL-2023]